MWLELEELIIIHFPKFNTLGDNTHVLQMYYVYYLSYMYYVY